MAWAAGSKFASVLHVLLLLRECARAAGGRAFFVSYNFTVINPEFPWCEFEGQVNGQTFLRYTCSQKAKCDFYNLSMRNITEPCKGEEETLKDLMEKFQKTPSQMKPKNSTTSDISSLKGEMTCQLEDNGRAFGSWDFYFNGKKTLHFDSKNKEPTLPLSPEGKKLNTLINDTDTYDFLNRNSPQMCERWHEKSRNHQDDALNTAAPVTSEPTTEPTTRTSATDESKNKNVTWILVGISLFIVFGSISIFLYRKRRCGQPARQEAPRGDCVEQDEEANILQIPEIPGEPSCSQSRDSQLPANWRERSAEGLCLEQRPATQTGSPVSCVSLSDCDF